MASRPSLTGGLDGGLAFTTAHGTAATALGLSAAGDFGVRLTDEGVVGFRLLSVWNWQKLLGEWEPILLVSAGLAGRYLFAGDLDLHVSVGPGLLAPAPGASGYLMADRGVTTAVSLASPVTFANATLLPTAMLMTTWFAGGEFVVSLATTLRWSFG